MAYINYPNKGICRILDCAKRAESPQSTICKEHRAEQWRMNSSAKSAFNISLGLNAHGKPYRRIPKKKEKGT